MIDTDEAARLVAYRDAEGAWRIGYGHTGPEVVEGSTCTQAEAEAWRETDGVA